MGAFDKRAKTTDAAHAAMTWGCNGFDGVVDT